MANAQRSRAANPAVSGRRRQDITGLLIFFLGAAGLVSLSYSQSEPFPSQINTLLRPLLPLTGSAICNPHSSLMAIGSMFLIGYERLTFTHASLGTLLLFLVFVTASHLAVVAHGDARINETIKYAGGWIGAVVGSALDSLCGRTIGSMFLVIVTLIAVVLLVDQPLIVIFRRMHERGKAGAIAAQRGIEKGAKVAEAMLPGRISGSNASQTSLPPAVDELSERDKRVARVAERALAPASEPIPVTNEPPKGTGPVGKSPGSFLNLFNLTKPRQSHETNDHDDPLGDPFDDAQPGYRCPVPQPRSLRPRKSYRSLPQAPIPCGGWRGRHRLRTRKAIRPSARIFSFEEFAAIRIIKRSPR